MARVLSVAARRKLSLGALHLPAWAVGVALPIVLLAMAAVAMAASSGQAVGPVLSGSITGSAGVTAQQALTVTTCDITTHSASDDALCAIGAQQTTFTAAIEMHRGDKPVISLGIFNASQVDVNGTIALSVPPGFDVEVEDTDSTNASLREAQMARSTWLLFVGVANSEKLRITLRPRPDVTPGFYTVSATINEILG
ncbi:MAG: hypothetical protein HY681_06485 [Chloroflexi bacterium]|nr:hypothetical protein [Chloroflexota bacterium]